MKKNGMEERRKERGEKGFRGEEGEKWRGRMRERDRMVEIGKVGKEW